MRFDMERRSLEAEQELSSSFIYLVPHHRCGRATTLGPGKSSYCGASDARTLVKAVASHVVRRVLPSAGQAN